MNDRDVFAKIRRLFALEGEEHGYSDAELAPLLAETRQMPAVLHGYYRTLGKHTGVNHTQDRLVTPASFPHVQLAEHLVFYVENQGCCFWGIHHQDLAQRNPPVWMTKDRCRWVKECGSLTDFLLTMAYLQAMFALPYASEGFLWLQPHDRAILEKHFQQKPFGFSKWLNGVAIYGNHDSDAIVLLEAHEAETQLRYASFNAAHFAQMESCLKELGDPL